jgi:hypothetical protein
LTLFASAVPSHDARMLALLPALLLTAAVAPTYEPELRSGETLEARVDGDLDGDGTADTAWLTSSEDKRELVVHLTDGATEALTLDTTPLGPGELSIDKGVLLFEDLTGGTTAIESKRRYRYDKNQIRMRLIGYDATLYSRTQQHDGFEVSWNLLTGNAIVRKLHLNTTGKGDEAYDHIYEKKVIKRSPPVWLWKTPAPEDLIERFQGG